MQGYGGIELIAQDLHEALSRYCEADLYCSTEEPTDHIRNYPTDLKELGGYDFYLDFTHEKLAHSLPRDRYAATVFHTDKPSYVLDIFPTHAVRRAFNLPGPVIYPGIKNRYRFSREKEDFLLFLGRISAIKRPDIAILVARRTNHRLIIAGHTGFYSLFPDPSYAEGIRRLCDGERILLLENPTHEQKVELLAKAKALIVPSDWSIIGSIESFGIVCVEALLSGTPIITSGNGGLAEITTPDVGFICRTLDEYCRAVKEVERIDPRDCLRRGLYYTSERMAYDYFALIEPMLHEAP